MCRRSKRGFNQDLYTTTVVKGPLRRALYAERESEKRCVYVGRSVGRSGGAGASCRIDCFRRRKRYKRGRGVRGLWACCNLSFSWQRRAKSEQTLVFLCTRVTSSSSVSSTYRISKSKIVVRRAQIKY